MIYLATSDSNNVVQGKTEVSTECKWFSAKELDQEDIKEHVKHYAKTALETLKE